MSYKYNFKDTDYVLINGDKLRNTLTKKGLTQTSVVKDLSWSSSSLSYAIVNNRINYGFLKDVCRVINVKPASYITSEKVDNKATGKLAVANSARIIAKNKGKKKPVKVKKEKKPTSGRYPWNADRKPNENDIKAMEKERNEKLEHEQHCAAAAIKPLPRTIEPDKPLIVELKANKSEIQELIDVQKEIRDALRELVEELK